jgi:hypothetical protein
LHNSWKQQWEKKERKIINEDLKRQLKKEVEHGLRLDFQEEARKASLVHQKNIEEVRMEKDAEVEGLKNKIKALEEMNMAMEGQLKAAGYRFDDARDEETNLRSAW